MKLIIENIGMLEKAEVTLHTLCVIAGENDNGKSTIGKIVFCLVKAINRYKEDLQESKEYRVQEKLEELFFFLRRMAGNSDANNEMMLELRRFISVRSGNQEDLLDVADKAVHQFGIDKNLDQKELKKADSLLTEIREILHEPENTKKSIENALRKVFASEFDSSLLLQGANKGAIRLIENEIELINLQVEENGIKLLSDVEPLEFKDATFVESPLIVNNHDLLVRSQTLLEVNRRRASSLGFPYTTLHNKDLFDKLRQPVLDIDLTKGEEINQLKELMRGEIFYEKKSRDFVFVRDSEEISIKNTASGIKVFGLLKILLDNEILTKNTMLIFDEPENHLHPKWQLKLAELLVGLASTGIYVMVSSHSPYMIEALKRYSEKSKESLDTGFFLAENRKIEDRDRLSDIFEVLAEPFEVFRRMDAEDLRDE